MRVLHNKGTSARQQPLATVLFVAFFVTAGVVSVLRFMAATGSQAVVAVAWRELEPLMQSDFFVLYGPIGLFYALPLFATFTWALTFGVSSSAAEAWTITGGLVFHSLATCFRFWRILHGWWQGMQGKHNLQC